MKTLKKISHVLKYFIPIIPFVCFFLGYLLCNLLFGNTTYKTPQLIGLSLHQAIEQTSPYHITIQLVAEKECHGVPQGTIISQKPSPGRLIKSRQSILVVTTKLPPATNAPDVLGKSEPQIEGLKKSNHLKFKTYNLNYASPKGCCIGQIPQPGQPVLDKKMILYVAKEKSNKYIMPNLIDKNVVEVIEFLKSHTLNISVFHQNQKITAPYSDKLKILAQKPLPGSLINLQDHATIQLEVSKNRTSTFDSMI